MRRRLLAGPFLAACALACSDSEPLAAAERPDAAPAADAGAAGAEPPSPAADSGAPALEADAAAEDAGGDSGDPPDAGAPPDPDPPPVVRFVALGDTGEGNQAQYDVAAVMETVCAVQGCDFALLLGDNFYDDGVRSVDDEQFETKFEAPYQNLQFPFYVTLGNHDFGEVPLQFWRTDYQVEYTMMSTKWVLPDHFYDFVEEHVTFISLDTNMIMLGLDWVRDQRGWIDERIAQADTEWIIAYGHHPYRSNGPHGNAGNYEGASFDPTGIIRGAEVKSFFEDHLCSKIDAYFAGHDHSRQWLETTCGVALVVSGAGAKLTELVRRDGNPTVWEDDTKEGFAWVEIAGRTMTVEFWDRDGNMSYSNVIQK